MTQLYNPNYVLGSVQPDDTEQYKTPKISKKAAEICSSLSLLVEQDNVQLKKFIPNSDFLTNHVRA